MLAAGGFSAEAALVALLSGQLPPEDPSTCAVSPAATTTIAIAARAPADVQVVGCDERTDDSSIRYREPPPNQLDVSEPYQWRALTCRHSILGATRRAEAPPRT